MGIGPTLLGGIVGATVGIGLHVILETGVLGQPYEASWFAVVIGLLTGVGVRQANRSHMQRSYLRGGIAGVIALAGIVASTMLISKVMRERDALIAAAPGAAMGANADAEESGDEGDNDDANAEMTADEQDAASAEQPASIGAATSGTPRVDGALNPWQFVFMALGALVAYELGRGGGAEPKSPLDATPPEGLGRATDPSD